MYLRYSSVLGLFWLPAIAACVNPEDANLPADNAVPADHVGHSDIEIQQTPLIDDDDHVAIVRSGESLGDVARRVGVSVEKLARFNGLDVSYRPRPGDVLVVPDVAEQTKDQDPGDSRQPVGNAGGNTRLHEVKPGETVFSIARLYGVTFLALVETNGLRDDHTLIEGQILSIPPAGRQVDSDGERSAPALPEPPQRSDQEADATAVNPPTASPDGSETHALPDTEATERLPRSEADAAPALASIGGRLLLPVEGQVLRHYSGGSSGSHGIDLAAPPGTAVRAASAGKVALISPSETHENIVLVRHADNLYTVYSRITDINVVKGQTINRGDIVGHVASKDPSYLHFQLRRGTESVDPMPYFEGGSGR